MGLLPLFRQLALAYYRLAMRQINPMHPDVPLIMARILELEGLR
jgi:hypothetical protein